MDRHKQESVTSSTNNSNTSERGGLDTLRKAGKSLLGRAFVAGAGVSVVLSVAGCSPSAEAIPKPTDTPTSQVEETPSATPTPEVTEAPDTEGMPDHYDYGLTEADIQGLSDTPLEPFTTLSIDDRAPLGMYHLQELPAFAESFHTVSGNKLDIGLPAEINNTNTVEQAWAQIANIRRLAITQKDADGFYIDPVAAKKIVLTTFIDPTSEGYQAYAHYIDTLHEDPAGDPSARTLAASGDLSFPISFDNKSELFVAPDGRECFNVTVTERLATQEKVESNQQLCLVGQPGKQIWVTR